MADTSTQTTPLFTPLATPASTTTNSGIVGGAMATPAPAPAPAVSNGIIANAQAAQLSTPTSWNVTPDQTAAGQITNLMNPDSPIIQQAVTQAKQNQVANGTLNSSIATTAGLDSAYKAITPIATNDAATYSKAASYNADMANQYAVKNQDATNSMTQANLASSTSLTNTGMNNASSQAIAKLNSDTTTNIAKLDNESKLQLQKMQTDNSTLLSTNAQAASLMTSATAALNNIAQSTSMDAAAKTEASKQVWANLTTQMNVIGKTSGLDLSSILGTNPYETVASPTGAAVPTTGTGYSNLSVNGNSGTARDAAGNTASVQGNTVTATSTTGQPMSVSMSAVADAANKYGGLAAGLASLGFGPVAGLAVNAIAKALGFAFGGEAATGATAPNSVGGIFNYGNANNAGFNAGYSTSQNQSGMGGWGGGGNSSSDNGGGDSSRGSQSDSGGRNGGDSGGF